MYEAASITMINFYNLKVALYNWAVANTPTGTPVIYYYANAPRPTVDYVTLFLQNFMQIGWDYTPAPSDNAGDVIMVGDREFTLQIQAYGTNSFGLLEGLRTSLQKQTVLDSLAVSGIVLVNWFPIQDITQLVDSRFEERGTLDILFRIAQQETDVLGTIAQLELQEIVYDVDATVILNQTVLLPPTI